MVGGGGGMDGGAGRGAGGGVVNSKCLELFVLPRTGVVAADGGKVFNKGAMERVLPAAVASATEGSQMISWVNVPPSSVCCVCLVLSTLLILIVSWVESTSTETSLCSATDDDDDTSPPVL